MRVTPIAAAFAAICSTVALAAPPPSDRAALDWLAGCWIERQEDRWAEECWTAPRGDQLLGSGRVGRGDSVGDWEFMRIERAPPGDSADAGRLTFFAAPKGDGWTRFVADPGGGQSVTFVNLDNDYPQRIRYWREGAMLKAEIAMRDGSRAKQWTFTRTNSR